jgi:gamma-glutamyltranspeptidase/glutathione hydrolase
VISKRARGLVVAASQPAADAGAAALAAGGNAVDAAVATGFALSVVDPPNCGVGGYGGFLTVLPADGDPLQVDFNTWPPAAVDPGRFRLPGDPAPLADGGRGVAPPAVVPGLLEAHAGFGRIARAEVVAPAIALAADGFAVGGDLARAFAEHWELRERRAEFGRVFFPGGGPLAAGERLVQPDLAGTLERIASDGAQALTEGPIAEAVCAAVQADAGVLEPDDLRRAQIAVAPAVGVELGSATVYGAAPGTSGAGVLFAALERLDAAALGANRSRAYVDELARVLAAAWDTRTGEARAALRARHTTTMCAADADGGLAALTFTHGSLWFGSGLVVPGTGIVLNAGANLFAHGPDGPRAVTNMSPLVIRQEDGARHALGGTGGPRIPGLLLTAIVDLVHYGLPLAEALAAPHLAVRALDGQIEAEEPLLSTAGRGHALGPRDYGPTNAVTRTADGRLLAATDPRFDAGVAAG